MVRIVRGGVAAAAIVCVVLGFTGGALSQPSGPSVPTASGAASKDKKKAPRKSQKQGNAKTGDEAADGGDNLDSVLEKARRALAEGKPEMARTLAETVLGAAKKEPRNTARALAIRGEARLRLGRPAEAISDLDSALWLKGGLAGGEREAAVTAKSQALQQSGLAVVGPPAIQPVMPAPPMPTVSPKVEEKRAAQALPVRQPPVIAAARSTTNPSPPPAPAVPPQQAASSSRPEPPAPQSAGTSSSGIGSFFSNLISPAKPTEPQGVAPSTTASVSGPATKSPLPATSSFAPQRAEPAKKTTSAADRQPVSAAPPAVRSASLPSSEAKPAPPSVTPGGYRLQLAAVRTKEEAADMMQRVREEEAALLGSRTYEIAEDVYGSMGRFYRVRIGTFAEPTEALAICSALRQKRLDCMVLDR